MDVTATGKGLNVPAAAPARAERDPTPTGKNLPAGGNSTPAPAPAADPAESVAKAVEQIRAYLRDSKTQIEFQVDDASGRTIMRILDGSGEVIRQIPSEEVLRIASMLDSMGFHSFSDTA